MGRKLTVVTADDWEALYLDDRLFDENHSLDVYDVLKHLSSEDLSQGFEVDKFPCDLVWLTENGDKFPISLAEVQRGD